MGVGPTRPLTARSGPWHSQVSILLQNELRQALFSHHYCRRANHTLMLYIVSASMLIFSPISTASDFTAEIDKAIDLCTDYIHPNMQAYTSGADREKQLHSDYLQYRSLANKLATAGGLKAIIKYAQHTEDDVDDWHCLLDMAGRSGLNAAVPFITQYKNKDVTGEMVDFYLSQYKDNPGRHGWKPKPYIEYLGQ